MYRESPTGFLYRDLPAKSNRLESQDAGVIGSQCFPVFAMLLSMISVGRAPALTRWTYGDIHPVFSDVDAYVCGFSFHVHLPCCAGSALQDTGLISPGNRSSSIRDECGDPRFSAVYHDQSSVGLPHSEQPGKRILSYSQRYKFAIELVSEVVSKALTSFVQNDIGSQQRH